jgi:phage tail-like protein
MPPLRGTVPWLESPNPLGQLLPSLYADDDIAQRWCLGLDEVIAPAIVTLDCFDAYLDPQLTPSDFIDWLAGWVGMALDQNWSERRRRDLIAQAVVLYRWQGTVKGVADHVALYTGAPPEIAESGGSAWSSTPGGVPPGRPVPELLVRVRLTPQDDIDESHLDAIVAAAKPAHISHRVEVVR